MIGAFPELMSFTAISLISILFVIGVAVTAGSHLLQAMESRLQATSAGPPGLLQAKLAGSAWWQTFARI
jgi:hypothetical protein